METIFLKLLNMSISASWLILAVLLLRLIMSKAPKSFVCVLWGIVAIRLICPFNFESVVSLIPSKETVPAAIISGPSFEVNSGVPIIDGSVNEYLGSRYFEGVTVPAENGFNVMNGLGWVWLLGLAILLIYAGLSYMRLRSQVAPSINLSDNLWICDEVKSPFILGIIRPKIYLPSALAEEQLSYVMAHENAHLKRHDHWWKPLGYMLLTVYWFNPLMWAAYVLLCRDIEVACDEKVLTELGQDCRKSYSEALLSCSVPRKTVSACPLAFGETCVKDRIKAVLNFKKPAFWIVAVATVTCLIVAICFLTNPKSPGSALTFKSSEYGPENFSTQIEVKMTDDIGRMELYAEQWYMGECTERVLMTVPATVTNFQFVMVPVKSNDVWSGLDIQLSSPSVDKSSATHFDFPEGATVKAFSFTGGDSYSANSNGKIQVYPDDDLILAAMYYDDGGGISAYDCETLSENPDKIKDVKHMVVVRGVFPAKSASEDSMDSSKYEAVPSFTLKSILKTFQDEASSSGCTPTGCITTPDGAYGLRGIVQYTDEDGNPCNLAFVKEGWFYPLGLDAENNLTIAESSSLTYMGNGAVFLTLKDSRSGELLDYTVQYSSESANINIKVSSSVNGLSKVVNSLYNELSDDVPISQLPTDYNINDAKSDGCIVHKNSDILYGEEVWDNFLESTVKAKPAYVRLANYNTIEDPSRYDPEYYEEIKDDYRALNFTDLIFDGEKYYIRSYDGRLESVKAYKYLMRYENKAESSQSQYHSYLRYVLTNENSVSWNDIWSGMLSSRWGDAIDHYEVYCDLID